MKLSITFFNQVKTSLLLIITSITSLAMFTFLEINTKKSLLIIEIPFFVIFILPSVYMHLNYYFQGNDIEYELDNQRIKIIKDKVEIIYTKDAFKEIKLYMSGTRLAGMSLRNFPFENYYYAKIVIEDNTEIIITCLFSQKIDKILESYYSEVPTLKIKDFYPII